ncbi:hypothetical protein VPH35_069206 [Triticum aestivum]
MEDPEFYVKSLIVFASYSVVDCHFSWTACSVSNHLLLKGCLPLTTSANLSSSHVIKNTRHSFLDSSYAQVFDSEAQHIHLPPLIPRQYPPISHIQQIDITTLHQPIKASLPSPGNVELLLLLHDLPHG